MRIVLLGDIVDLLKSPAWAEEDLRPWDNLTERHGDFLVRLVNQIVAANSGFFECFSALRERFDNVEVTYVFGNHDRLLGETVGRRACGEIERALGPMDYARTLVDADHMVLAKHGHEWDQENLQSPTGIVTGDVVVVELVVGLPLAVASRLGLDPRTGELNHLADLDAVLPQSNQTRSRWLAHNLVKLLQTHPTLSKRAVIGALQECAEKFIATVGRGWWAECLSTMVDGFERPNLVFSSLLPRSSSDSAFDCLMAREYLDSAAEVVVEDDHECRYLVCGHTHEAAVIPIGRPIESNHDWLYLNTGTWKRHHALSPIEESFAIGHFSEVAEYCSLVLYRADEVSASHPLYQLNRGIYGR